jgi:hypothetical protein
MMRLLSLVIAGLVAVVAFGSGLAPVDAHADPNRPVVGLDLRVYKYPEFQTTRLACDGTDIVTFSSIRIEPIVVLDPAPEWKGVNGEHWSVRIVVKGGDPQGSVDNQGNPRVVLLWDALWRNQNTPAPTVAMEASQSNTYRPLDGPAEIFVQVIGSVTGNTFTSVCPFTVDS